jgi:glycosyltransferase involved in cell wall biosynthesis
MIAAGDGRTSARLVRTFDDAQPESSDEVATIELAHAARARRLLESLDVDVVHDHTHAGALVAWAQGVPTVVTVHVPVMSCSPMAIYLGELSPQVSLVAISDAQRASTAHLPWAATVHNGLHLGDHPYRGDKADFVLYLGRVSADKGVHLAIDAARAAGRRLVLAGSWTIPKERVYFEREIRPRLGAGVDMRGMVGGAEKKRLLSEARCLLFPSVWGEPFGLAMIEALACGTPVVGLRAGAVPEVIRHGVTGFVCDDAGDLAAAVEAADGIDPSACRTDALRRFGAEKMTHGYEKVYRRAISESGRRDKCRRSR